MKSIVSMFALVIGCGYTAGLCAQENELDQFPLDVLPAVDPAALQEIAAVGDAEFVQRLFAGAALGRSALLDRYYPPGTSVFPLSHGFAGPQSACLQTRRATPCRIYVDDLLAIQARKQPRGALNNPFGGAR